MPQHWVRRTWRQQQLVTILAAVAFIAIVAITALSTTPERITGGARIGEVVYDLALAYLGAWVFNILVVVLPRLRTEELVLKELRNPIQGISGTGATLLYALATQAAQTDPSGAIKPLPDPLPALSTTQVDDLCASIDIGLTWPQFLTDAPTPNRAWAQYLAYDAARIHGFIQRVQPAYPLLDSELVAAIQAIANSSYMLQVPKLPAAPPLDLAFLASPLHEVHVRCQRLGRYFDEQVRPLVE